jgi:hypothetical protein
MAQQYEGLPAAANIEQAIILAQLLIVRDLERRAQSDPVAQLLRESELSLLRSE